MGLVRCPECAHALSDRAAACPQCGLPFGKTPHGRRMVLVVEQTAKAWKQLRVLGWLLMGIGGAVSFPQWAAAHSAGVWLGSLIGAAGGACVWVSRAGAWWFHG